MRRLVQSMRTEWLNCLWFTIFSILVSLLFNQIRSVYFSLSLAVLSTLIYIACTSLIQRTKLKWCVYTILAILSGLLLFYIFKGQEEQYVNQDFIREQAQITENTSTYKIITTKMRMVTPKEYALVLERNASVVLYVGRESCPYCRDFVSQLQSIDVSSVYYMDTEEKSDDLYAFVDRYKLDSIPQLLRFQDKEIIEQLDIHGRISSEEIAAFIQD